jgi:flavin reductase (DIM6/NTAB) family NADH-FMN oxidoreductase RutF/DNA-binding GntR family transcriptional regulator
MGTAEFPVDQRAFRDVIGRFASGVTVITTRLRGKDFGTTASAVSSLSMDPPMLLICLNKSSETQRAVFEAGWFVVNILRENQADLAYAFAKKSPDKFERVGTMRATSGAPMISHALAHIECRVSETATGGTHTVFMGEVHQAAAGAEGDPLTYYRGRFGRFHDMLQDAAYRRIRTMVVTRELPRGVPLDVEQLSSQLQLEEAHVFYALTKLTADGLVQRDAEGRLSVKPLDVASAEDAIDARCAIETAVVDKVAGSLSASDAARLRTSARQAEQAANERPVDMVALGRAGRDFHEHFVGLLASEALSSFVRRLDFHVIWATVAPDIERLGRINASYLPGLVDACVAGDREEAKRLLRDHAATIREYAREAIEHAGGEM